MTGSATLKTKPIVHFLVDKVLVPCLLNALTAPEHYRMLRDQLEREIITEKEIPIT